MMKNNNNSKVKIPLKYQELLKKYPHIKKSQVSIKKGLLMLQKDGLLCELYAHAGTLLGVKHWEGFIPWDDDVDLIKIINSGKDIIEFKELLIKKGYKVFWKKGYILKILIDETFIDIIFFKKGKVTNLRRFICGLVSFRRKRYEGIKKVMYSPIKLLMLPIPLITIAHWFVNKQEINDTYIPANCPPDYLSMRWNFNSVKSKVMLFEGIEINVISQIYKDVETRYDNFNIFPEISSIEKQLNDHSLFLKKISD